MSAGLSRSLRWRALIRQSGSIQAVMVLNLIFFTTSYFPPNEVVYGSFLRNRTPLTVPDKPLGRAIETRMYPQVAIRLAHNHS